MWIRLLTVALSIGVLASVARAQTTQPTNAWHDAVARLSEALRGKDLGSLQRVLSHGPVIRTFSSDALLPPERLLGATTGARVLSLHAYLNLPSTLASDLSSDFRDADVPEAVRRDFVISDVAMERDANDIAARWMTNALKPSDDAPVAVIVLWRQERNDSFQNSAAKRPIFLLIRGELTDDQYVIRQITHGDPLERSR